MWSVYLFIYLSCFGGGGSVYFIFYFTLLRILLSSAKAYKWNQVWSLFKHIDAADIKIQRFNTDYNSFYDWLIFVYSKHILKKNIIPL